MEGIRQTTMVIGEGITEFFFLNSLKDDYKVLRSVKPDYPKNSNLEELEFEIKRAVRDYQRVFCIIDMDNKQEGTERKKYLELKSKYHQKHIVDEKNGIDCQVRFLRQSVVQKCSSYTISFTQQKNSLRMMRWKKHCVNIVIMRRE